MNKTIGFLGPNLINQIGPKEDILAFFQLVEEQVVKKYPENDWSLITDRFYKRYLRWEELEPAYTLMQRIREIFSVILSNTVKWKNLGINENTLLKLEEKFLSGVFEGFFKNFDSCINMARWRKCENDYYSHVRIIIAEIPECMKDKLRPLSDYDNLEGEPFWLR